MAEKGTPLRHLLSLFDISQVELQQVLTIAEQVKAKLAAGQRPAFLAGHVLAMIFEKQSLRTRVSFEAGIAHFGGTAMFLGAEVGWRQREATSDFIRVLAEYVDFVVCRAKSHESVEELASFNCVPVINGLTDWSHPCQALADLLTMRQEHSTLEGKQVTFVGDGNNVSRSMALACAMTGMRFRLLGPKAYHMDLASFDRIRERYPEADLDQSESLPAMLSDADFVYTDVWTSMGQEAESEQRRKDFGPFQVNATMMGQAPEHCKILHCLPAKRDEEITDSVIDGANSLIVTQAGNRMHAQKGLLLWLALQQGQISVEELGKQGVTI